MRSQDLALTIFGNHLRDEASEAWSGGMVQLLGEFGFSIEAAGTAEPLVPVSGWPSM